MAIDLLCSITSSSNAQLCLRYWAQNEDGSWCESLENIGQAFDLSPVEVERRAARSSLAHALGHRCTVCNTPQNATTRSAYRALLPSAVSSSYPCQSAACELAQRPLDLNSTVASLNNRAEQIWAELQRSRHCLKPIDYSHLRFFDAFYLYCLLQAAGDSLKDNEMPSMATYTAELTPTQLLAERMYAQLRASRIVVPSIYSSVRAFNVADFANGPITYDFTQVSWTLAPGNSPVRTAHLQSVLLASFTSVPVEAVESLRQILIEHECLRILIRALQMSNIQTNTPMEAALFSSIHYTLSLLPVNVTMTAIRLVARDHQFLEKAQREDLVSVGKLTSETLKRYAKALGNWRFLPDVKSAHNDTILKKSTSLTSQIFYGLFGDGQ